MNGLTLAMLGLCLQVEPTLPSIEVEAVGMAPSGSNRVAAIREATRDAQERAIEQVAGVHVAALDVGRDYRIQTSARLAFLQGLILRWEPVGDPIEDLENRLIKVHIRARVLSVRDLKKNQHWSALWKTFGHPPLQLTFEYSGDTAHKAVVLQQAKTSLLSALQEVGIQGSGSKETDGGMGVWKDGSQHTKRPTSNAQPWFLRVHVRLQPVSSKGNPEAPYGIGDMAASWQAQVTLELGSSGKIGSRQSAVGSREQSAIRHPPSKIGTPPHHLTTSPPDALHLGAWQATISSVVSDADAAQKAIQAAIQKSLQQDWRKDLNQTWLSSLLGGEFKKR